MAFGSRESAWRRIRIGVMLSTLAVSASAQNLEPKAPAAPQSNASDDAIPASVFSQLLDSQPASNQPYQLGQGDNVSISVEGRPELASKQVIGPDGSITLPLIGSIVIADKTRDQAAETIREALLRFYTFPVVTLTVDGYNSNRVLLLGAVATPGMQVFDHTPTLLEVLARGGGSSRGALLSRTGTGITANASTEALPDKAVIYRSSEAVINLSVRKLVASGSPLANVRLKRNDVVFVPSSTDQYISVLGFVQRPGSQVLESQMTLTRILADAGGLLPQAGKNPKIRVISANTAEEKDVFFKDLLNPRSSEIRVHPGDIVYVPQSGFNGIGYSVQQLSPLISIFATSALLNQR